MDEFSYKMVTNGPKAVEWDDYAANARKRYTDLLESDPSESEIQKFLEQNPSFIPGGKPPIGDHGAYPWAVITQPTLTGLNSKIPDFLWITTQSANWFPTLVEIEKPGKRLFLNNSTRPRAEFTQARNQLDEWNTWFDSPTNQQRFIEDYGVPDLLVQRPMLLRLILVYGRRAEFAGHPERTAHRANLVASSQELVSYDRLIPDSDLWYAMTVRTKGQGRFQAVSVPPTFQIGPFMADDLLLIDGIPEAINSNDEIPIDRKQFLIERLGYWIGWAKKQGTPKFQKGGWE